MNVLLKLNSFNHPEFSDFTDMVYLGRVVVGTGRISQFIDSHGRNEPPFSFLQ
jgi:hypothetical protein